MPVNVPESVGFNLQDVCAGPWRWTIYRSVSRPSRSAAVITLCTVDRETRNTRAMAACLSRASKAAGINRCCPGVATALRAVRDFARAGSTGPGLSARRLDRGGLAATSRPRRRAFSDAAVARRSCWAGAASPRDRPAGRGPAPPVGSLRFPAVGSWPSSFRHAPPGLGRL